MIVECTACSTMFPVDPKKIPAGGVHARCSVCNAVFFVSEPEPDLDPAEKEVMRPPEEGELDHSEVTTEDAGDDILEEAGDDFVEDAGDDLVGVAEEDFEGETEPTLEEMETTFGEAETTFGEADTTFEEMETTFGEMETDSRGMEANLQEAGPIEYGTEPPSWESAEDFGEEAGHDTVEEVEEAPALAAPVFGKRDPTEKAQRLARVLVSDIILYNPDRHHMASESGRVKEEFQEEIQKSWNEYVEQVGEELANSTNFFNDALNEILARGEQIF